MSKKTGLRFSYKLVKLLSDPVKRDRLTRIIRAFSDRPGGKAMMANTYFGDGSSLVDAAILILALGTDATT